MNRIEISVAGPLSSVATAAIEDELKRRGFAFRYAPAAGPATDPTGDRPPIEGLGALDPESTVFVLRHDHRPEALSADADWADLPLGVEFTATAGWVRLGWGGRWPPSAAQVRQSHPLLARIAPRDVNGHAMVSIPAFFYRVEHDDGRYRLWVSSAARSGFRLHPAFMVQGQPAPEILIGAYEVSEIAGQIASEAGMTPLTRITLLELKELAAELGDGWGVWSAHELAAIQMLALIDLGHPDVQAALGEGHVYGDGPVDTGASDAVWRGMHELWGNCWHWVDGLFINAGGEFEAWDRDGYRTWVSTGIRAENFAGYPSQISTAAALDHMFMPAGPPTHRDDAMLPDFCWRTSASRWPIHGGYWSSGSNAGLFNLNLRYVASNSRTYLGGRLALRVPCPAT